MIKSFPYEYLLADETRVVVEKSGADTYEFLLTPKEGEVQRFRFTDYERPKAEVEATLNFEQLDALRTFLAAAGKLIYIITCPKKDAVKLLHFVSIISFKILNQVAYPFETLMPCALKAEVSDTTGDAMKTIAGNQKLIMHPKA